MPFDQLKMVSDEWFQSVMVYCLPLFGGCGLTKLQELQVIQNKVARVITKSHQRRNRCEIYDQLNWFTVKQLIVYHTLLTIFRIKDTSEPEELASILNRENRNKNIIIPQSNLTLYRMSFIYRGISLWNKLPESCKYAKKLKYFKVQLRKWIKEEISIF